MFPRISRIRAWSHGYRILAQVLILIPRPDMQSLDNAYGADRARQAPSRWSQFDALICAQLTGRHSLVMSSVPRHGKPKHPKDLLDHGCIRVRFGRGALLDCEFEKAGKAVKVSPPAKLIANYPGLAQRAARDGVGYWMTFEDYAREGIKSGALVSVLDDWCAPFPGPFLYYPSRRQPPPALAAFVAFVAEWRKQERRKTRTV